MHCRQSVNRAWVPTVQTAACACNVLRAARQLSLSVQPHAHHASLGNNFFSADGSACSMCSAGSEVNADRSACDLCGYGLHSVDGSACELPTWIASARPSWWTGAANKWWCRRL